MSFRVFILSWSRAFTCIAFALALVFSPPSAAHAASGMHDGHQAKSVGVVGAAMTHDTGSDAHEKLGVASAIDIAASDKDGKEQQSQECCNGICISVVFIEDSRIRAEPVGTSEYVILDGQTYSVETAGFFRPPRFLI